MKCFSTPHLVMTYTMTLQQSVGDWVDEIRTDLAIDDGREGQVVKDFRAVPPNCD